MGIAVASNSIRLPWSKILRVFGFPSRLMATSLISLRIANTVEIGLALLTVYYAHVSSLLRFIHNYHQHETRKVLDIHREYKEGFPTVSRDQRPMDLFGGIVYLSLRKTNKRDATLPQRICKAVSIEWWKITRHAGQLQHDAKDPPQGKVPEKEEN